MSVKSSQRIVSPGKKDKGAVVKQENASPVLDSGVKLVRNHLFVISVDAYKFCPPLYNAIKDADDFVRVLTTQYDFDPKYVTRLLNEQVTESAILAQLEVYATKLSENDNLVIYYSGHGTYKQTIDEGYWVPFDVGFRKETGLIDTSYCVPNSVILKYLAAIKSLHTVVIADACFSGSLATQRLVTQGAQRLETIPSRVILSAGRNEPVLDGKPGDNSPFASALLNYLEKNATETLSFVELGLHVQKAVANNAKQIPICARLQNVGDQNGDFVFRRRWDEDTYWKQIQRLNAIEGYKNYLLKYPNGVYVADAKLAIERLERPTPVVKEGSGEIAVRQGTILYDVPNKMQLRQEVKCVVRIAFEEVMAKLDYKLGEDTVIKEMRVSNVMSVDFLDPSRQTFEIRPINASQQFIDRDYFTQWLFYVKPLKEGNHILLIKVTVIEEINGKERPREIVLEETVSIVSNLPKPEPSNMRMATRNPVILRGGRPPKLPHQNGGIQKTGGEIVPPDELERSQQGAVPTPLPEQPPVPSNVGKRRWIVGSALALAMLGIFVGQDLWKQPEEPIIAVHVDTNMQGLANRKIDSSQQIVEQQNQDTVKGMPAPEFKKPLPKEVAKKEPLLANNTKNNNTKKTKPIPTSRATSTGPTVADKDRIPSLAREVRSAKLSDRSFSAARFSFREPPKDMRNISKEDAEAWKKAIMNGEAEAYQKYMERMPQGGYLEYAKERWETLSDEKAWHQTQIRNTPEMYEQYERDYPAGRHLEEAKTRKKELQKQ